MVAQISNSLETNKGKYDLVVQEFKKRIKIIKETWGKPDEESFYSLSLAESTNSSDSFLFNYRNLRKPSEEHLIMFRYRKSKIDMLRTLVPHNYFTGKVSKKKWKEAHSYVDNHLDHLENLKHKKKC